MLAIILNNRFKCDEILIRGALENRCSELLKDVYYTFFYSSFTEIIVHFEEAKRHEAQIADCLRDVMTIIDEEGFEYVYNQPE